MTDIDILLFDGIDERLEAGAVQVAEQLNLLQEHVASSNLTHNQKPDDQVVISFLDFEQFAGCQRHSLDCPSRLFLCSGGLAKHIAHLQPSYLGLNLDNTLLAVLLSLDLLLGH